VFVVNVNDQQFFLFLSRTLVGAKPYTDGIPAKLYNINKEYLTFEQVIILLLTILNKCILPGTPVEKEPVVC
jgi:hypothetical protein